MDNAAWLDQHAPHLDLPGRSECLAAMERCGDNHWWEQPDRRVRAFWQLQDLSVQLMDDFRDGLVDLLGRPVWSHELAYNLDGLRNEATNALLGAVLSKDEKAALETDGYFSVIRGAALNGNGLVIIDPEAGTGS